MIILAANTDFMSISFIIPAKNEAEGIGRTIEYILKQPEHLVKEIIVADNGSTDNTAGVAAAYSKTRVITVTEPGTNIARESARKIATGEIIAFIDADNWLAPDWSEMAVKYLSKPDVVGVSGPYAYRDQGSLGRFISLWGFMLYAYPGYMFVHYVLRLGSVVLGGNVAAKREALEKMGGLDTRFKFFGDDVRIGKQLRKFGRVIFTPRLLVYSSSRRFQKRGYFRTILRYFMNYLWVMLFDKPFTK